uniref:Uncharacterized protein n=1 Tax=Anguilla anguilla TaxID=7936 RepID=A0A0E9W2J2_ANGAN
MAERMNKHRNWDWDLWVGSIVSQTLTVFFCNVYFLILSFVFRPVVARLGGFPPDWATFEM